MFTPQVCAGVFKFICIVVQQGGAEDVKLATMLVGEGKRLLGLNSPSIVRVYGFCVSPPCVVMEWCGSDLAHWIRTTVRRKIAGFGCDCSVPSPISLPRQRQSPKDTQCHCFSRGGGSFHHSHRRSRRPVCKLSAHRHSLSLVLHLQRNRLRPLEASCPGIKDSLQPASPPEWRTCMQGASFTAT